MNEMKHHHFNLSHHCKSIKNQNNENCTCHHVIIPPRPITRCNGTCFQRDFYQHKQHPYPSYINHPMPFTVVQPWSLMPLTCNPSFNYPFHESSYFKKIKTKQKSLDPSSYRVTVRRITPLHVAVAAAEAYRAHRNKDSDRIHLEPFYQIITSPDQKFRTTQTTNLYGRDDFNSDIQNIPSVPSKKIVPKNDGIQVSSTSFMTTTDDQKSCMSDNVSETSSKHHMIRAGTLNELSFSMTEEEKSINDSFALFKPNLALPIINLINPITINRSEDITTKKNIDNISNQSLITKQIESKRSNVVEEHSSIKPQLTIDKVERYEKQYFIEEKFSPLELLHHDMPNELDINIPESLIKPSLIDISRPPTLPSSLPPNIDKIKSNEMLVNSSRSTKSITSLINEKPKSSTDIRNSNLPLRTTRSTVDFGFLLHETTTENF